MIAAPFLAQALMAAALAAAPPDGPVATQPTGAAPAATSPSAPSADEPRATTIDDLVEDMETAASASPLAPAPAAPPSGPGPRPYEDEFQVYEAHILAAAETAQAEQGPLDGRWTLASRAGGAQLYRFQFADRGLGFGLAQGAWRDLKSISTRTGSGFITSIAFDGTQLMLRFDETGPDDLVVVTVKPSGSGWAGQLWRHGVSVPVTLQRN